MKIAPPLTGFQRSFSGYEMDVHGDFTIYRFKDLFEICGSIPDDVYWFIHRYYRSSILEIDPGWYLKYVNISSIEGNILLVEVVLNKVLGDFSSINPTTEWKSE